MPSAHNPRVRVGFSLHHPETWFEGASSGARRGIRSFGHTWRRSLRFRTLVVTIASTLAASLAAGLIVIWAIQANLFAARVSQVLADSSRALTSAQAELDAVDAQSDGVRLQTLLLQVQSDIAVQAASSRIAVFRIDDTPSDVAPPGFVSPGLSEAQISPELRESVRASPERYWQSVTLTTSAGERVPGIIVGQQLSLPQAGPYELYLGFDLADAERTLLSVQRTLWLGGFVLVFLIAGIAWLVLRSVTGPISLAASTSARFAAGDLDVRLPVRGEDELATLGRSFNAMADSITAQLDELAELSLVQQRFVSDVSHELRTPLTTIRLAADLINDGRDAFPPTTKRAAELLDDQVRRFEVLLTDLLEISRYDAGSVQLELEPTSLATLADDEVRSMGALAAQHGTEVRLLAPGGYVLADMDPRRIRRVVRNLIGNAIEHCEGTPVIVTVDSNAEAVALAVRDFGLGMSPEQAGRVFDRFWRADPSRKRSIGGSGLGLSIALGDAQLHGGTLSVWSAPGEGSHFVLTMPRHRGSAATEPPIVAQAPEPGERGET